MKSRLERVGIIGVDAGLCWVGDPCYCVTPDCSSHPAKTWQEFCDKLAEIEKQGTAQWNFPLGHAGLGVTVQTGWGDGSYPVYVRRSPEGRVIEVVVKFK
jgi:hypothetical protein